MIVRIRRGIVASGSGLTAVLVAASAGSALVIWACGETNPAATGCGGDPGIFISPTAGPALTISPASAGDAASPATPPGLAVTISGTVVNAPCGVHGVSVANAIVATPTLANYATWAATVPLDLLESQGTCRIDAGPGTSNDAGFGVMVNAQALIVQDPGAVDLAVTQSLCVTLVQSGLPNFCPWMSSRCTAPPDDNGPAGVLCQVPESPGNAATLAVFGDNSAIGRQVTWKSAGGLSLIESPLAAMEPATDAGGESIACAAGCQSCGSESFATVLGMAGAAAGIDQISAFVDGYPDPVATAVISIQGPAKILASSGTLPGYAPVLITVQNPMAFSQTCTFALPAGVQFGAIATVDGGVPLNVRGCPLSSDDAGALCTFQTSTTAPTQLYEFFFSPEVSDSVARANNLGASRPISVACVDPFSQVGTASVQAAWVFAPSLDGGTDAGVDAGSDAGPSDSGGPG